MMFDKQAAREICIKLGLRYPARALISDDYQCALAAEMLPAALDHIDELENALIEERARGNHYGISYEDLAENREIERWIIGGEKDVSEKYLNLMRGEAHEQLHAEGLI